MASLHEIVTFLDGELRTGEIPDYPGAVNGLQLENGGEVGKVISAVDASLPVIEKAVDAGGDLLVVHHGMFWQGAQPLTGAFYRKIQAAMQAGLAIYSSHLPLDVHPTLGNNALLAKAMGLQEIVPFLEWKGIFLGVKGRLGCSREECLARAQAAVDASVHVCPGGPEVVDGLAIATGGAGSQVADVAAAGIGSFLTGEGPHWSYPLAEELEVNVLYAGHYATETFGVRAVGEVLAEKFGIEFEFVDHPTGL